MAHLLIIPENVMIQQLFPYLDHNDLLRLRRVSKQTKALADAYLWTPQPGHQGNWELKIDSWSDQTLQAFLQLGPPPPSRLHIVDRAEQAPSEERSFFQDEHLEEFMERYGKYVTKLTLNKLFFPFTSAKELGFYESLVNLKKLRCDKMITVGGAAQFEKKTRNAKGSFLIRPTFKKLKVFKLYRTDCMDSMANFINGVSNNLEELLHPFHWRHEFVHVFTLISLSPILELIERRSMLRQSELVYDWIFLSHDIDPLELLRVFASCQDNGVMIKNLNARYLRCLLCDANGRIADRDEVVDPISQEWIGNSAVNYQRNLYVRNVIHSLVGLTDNVFLMEMPALESITIFRALEFRIYRRRGVGYPQWTNLRKMDVHLAYNSRKHVPFLLGDVKRPTLGELSLTYGWSTGIPGGRLPLPRNLGNCCGNLKKLTIRHCAGDNKFFLALWHGLPLLEHVTLIGIMKLTNKGFIGNEVVGRRPAFLKLEKLKHFAIRNLDRMPRLTNTVFTKVFRHLKLSSFKLSSDWPIRSNTVAGIEELLTGSFANTIQKLDFDWLKLQYVSKKELKEVVSSFRSSKML